MARTIGETLRSATAGLMGVSGSPRLDSQLILGHVLGQPREYLIAHPERDLSPVEDMTFAKLLTLRQKGMPLAYILGHRPFFDREFTITPSVLIPRPETEHLVEAAIAWGADRGAVRVVDVGTGSGVIALSLAAHLPAATVVATDISAGALAVARHNGAGLSNIYYVQTDLLQALHGPIDLICANLPYIATGELNILEVAKFEPRVALDGGSDGLRLIRRLLTQAPERLARPGLLLLEIGADQGAAVERLAQTAFPNGTVRVLKDYGGLDRVVSVLNSHG
ncbi:MAG TPA: peptide chain release factor N(5)-glutamine methyltransferase [Aggregatilineales bacterium]|nr:peptide chain release factor N(5)-glutamine methyltransferase [Aggregatilineales bacterium]